MESFDQAVSILNVKDNLGYYLGRYIALIKYFPTIDLNDQETQLMLEELEIENIQISDLETIFNKKDQTFINQYIIGYMDTAPIMSYPYDIPYIDIEKSEREFLSTIFSDFEYPQNILFYHQKYLKLKNNNINYKKTSSLSIDLEEDENGFYNLYAVSKSLEENNLVYMNTDLVLTPPNGYYFEIIPHEKILELGYIAINKMIIYKEQEVIIPLIQMYEETIQIYFPLLVAKLILKKK